MKKLIFCIVLIASFSACTDESEEIVPVSIDVNDTMVATDGDGPPPTNHGSN